MSSLVIMGSGETAPTLVPVHREIFAATELRCGPVHAALVDTPFGFQLNADELVTRTLGYFAQSVGQQVQVATWRRADDEVLSRERTLALLQQATWAFSGPGSPSYALRQWAGTAMPQALADVARRGGTLLLGSAAAVTLGSHAIPVYEIYKAGEPPRWLEGLDLLHDLTGLRAAVVPHYDNTEGGTHDTRFCYLGEPRLAGLEAELPADVGVLGVDEHTALWFDLEARTARVLGRGAVTARRRGACVRFLAGATVRVDELDALLRGVAKVGSDGVPPPDVASAAPPALIDTAQVVTSLREAAAAAQAAFDTALAARDAGDCVAAVLGLEQAVADWSTDMLQSDDTATARRTLRSLVVRLGELAEHGIRDPRESVAPFVDALLTIRTAARAGGDYATGDLVRDHLIAAGVLVQDTPTGAHWHLA